MHCEGCNRERGTIEYYAHIIVNCYCRIKAHSACGYCSGRVCPFCKCDTKWIDGDTQKSIQDAYDRAMKGL